MLSRVLLMPWPPPFLLLRGGVLELCMSWPPLLLLYGGVLEVEICMSWPPPLLLLYGGVLADIMGVVLEVEEPPVVLAVDGAALVVALFAVLFAVLKSHFTLLLYSSGSPSRLR